MCSFCAAEQGLVALPVISRCAQVASAASMTLLQLHQPGHLAQCLCLQGLSGRGQLQVLVTANTAGCSVLQGLLPEQVSLIYSG